MLAARLVATIRGATAAATRRISPGRCG